jgi:hypothetical protein
MCYIKDNYIFDNIFFNSIDLNCLLESLFIIIVNELYKKKNFIKNHFLDIMTSFYF